MHQVKAINWKLIIRIIYFCLTIYIDYLSYYKKVSRDKIHNYSWGLSLISLFPIPLYYTAKKQNILLNIFIYIFPFYILLTRSYEALFIIIFYNYLQLWIKLKFRDITQNNYIDIFFYMSISYSSFFSLNNIDSISNSFKVDSVFKFISDDKKNASIIILLLIKNLLPTLFTSSALFEICNLYKYSINDTLFMIISMCEIMNIKFFFDIKEWGSWREIGMSIAYFIVSNIISFIQFFIFIFMKMIFYIDNKLNKCYITNNEIETNLNKDNINEEIEKENKNLNDNDFIPIKNEDVDEENDKDNDNEASDILKEN